MLKSCRYCGKLHQKGEKCPKYKKLDYTKKDEAYDFRNSGEWQRKRVEIKERDRYLCQACLRKLPSTVQQYTSRGLEVHHIRGLRKNWEARLDDDNLITLCVIHHKMADRGEISAEILAGMIPPTI